MALFFDQDWFETKMKEAGVTHETLAEAAGLTLQELVAVYKDQMIVSAGMVKGFARCLEVETDEVAKRCGIATPDCDLSGTLQHDRDLILTRLESLENQVAWLTAELAELKTDSSEEPA